MQKQIPFFVAGFLLLPFWTAPSFGQEREYTPGLHHSTLWHDPAPQDATAGSDSPLSGYQKTRIPYPARPQIPHAAPVEPEAAGTDTAPDSQKETAEKIWEKYKALVAGGSDTPETEQTQDSKHATSLNNMGTGVDRQDSAPARPPEPSAPQAGISSVLQEWQSNKAEQKEMRARHYPIPDNLKSFRAGQGQKP